MAEALTVFNDAGVFNVVSATVFVKLRKWFSVDTPIGSMEVTHPPHVRFLYQEPDPYLARGQHLLRGRDLELTIRVKLTFEETVIRLMVQVRADVFVRNGELHVHRVRVHTESGSQVLDVLVNLMVGTLIEQVAETLDGLRLPEVNQVFGVEVNARLQAADIVQAYGLPLLRTLALFGEGSAPRAFSALRALPLHRDHGMRLRDGWSAGSIEVVVPQSALNAVADRIFEGRTFKIKERQRLLFAVAYLRAKFKVSKIKLVLKKGDFDARAGVKVKRLRAGVRFFGIIPTWLPLNIKGIDAAVEAAMRTLPDGRTLRIEFEGLEELNLQFRKIRTLLGLPIAIYDALLEAMVETFAHLVSDLFEGTDADIVVLPESLLGTPLSLRFDGRQGLVIRPGRMTSRVMVRPADGVIVPEWTLPPPGPERAGDNRG